MSYGQELLRRYLTAMLGDTPRVNYRPDWLHGMELDLYFDSIRLGVEFQGDQHSLPIYGYDSRNAQRERDKAKKRICRELGVRFLPIEAIDLQYSRIICKLKHLTRDIRGFRKFISRREIRPRLRQLNKEAIEYRRTLSKNYGAPSAHRKGYKRRLMRYEWLSANGYEATQPIPPEVKRARRAARKAATKAHIERLAAQGLSMLPP